MLQEDLRRHRKGMKRLNDRMMDMERMMEANKVFLEDLAKQKQT